MITIHSLLFHFVVARVKYARSVKLIPILLTRDTDTTRRLRYAKIYATRILVLEPCSAAYRHPSIYSNRPVLDCTFWFCLQQQSTTGVQSFAYTHHILVPHRGKGNVYVEVATRYSTSLNVLTFIYTVLKWCVVSPKARVACVRYLRMCSCGGPSWAAFNPKTGILPIDPPQNVTFFDVRLDAEIE